MALQTFTAGQVLTAAQLTSLQANDYNQTVSAKTSSYTLVAADKGTRITMSSASATTITVNTSLFAAGDSLRIQNLNGGGVCTVTAGTATVTSAGPLAIPSWGGGQLYFTSASAAIWFPDAATASSGLVCVKAETTFTGAASVTADSIFTSSYTNYVLMFNFTTSTTNFPSLKLRVGGVSAGTNYTSQQIQGFSGAVATNARSAAADFSFAYYGNGTKEAAIVNIMGPQLAQATQFITGGGALGGALVQSIYGLHTTATAYDGIEILVPSGTMTGTYAVYGYAKTV
jgi:hypothetical protein